MLVTLELDDTVAAAIQASAERSGCTLAEAILAILEAEIGRQ